MPVSNLRQQLGGLLESGKGCDVTFVVDGETFSAHKLVLATRSPVFRAQLFGPLRGRNTERIEIEDMESPIFKVLSLSCNSLSVITSVWPGMFVSRYVQSTGLIVIGKVSFLGSLPFFFFIPGE